MYITKIIVIIQVMIINQIGIFVFHLANV